MINVCSLKAVLQKVLRLRVILITIHLLIYVCSPLTPHPHLSHCLSVTILNGQIWDFDACSVCIVCIVWMFVCTVYVNVCAVYAFQMFLCVVYVCECLCIICEYVCVWCMWIHVSGNICKYSRTDFQAAPPVRPLYKKPSLHISICVNPEWMTGTTFAWHFLVVLEVRFYYTKVMNRQCLNVASELSVFWTGNSKRFFFQNQRTRELIGIQNM